MKENGGGRRGDDPAKGMGSMRAVGWSVRGESEDFPLSAPSRYAGAEFARNSA